LSVRAWIPDELLQAGACSGAWAQTCTSCLFKRVTRKGAGRQAGGRLWPRRDKGSPPPTPREGVRRSVAAALRVCYLSQWRAGGA
jgi:hypothetical protein